LGVRGKTAATSVINPTHYDYEQQPRKNAKDPENEANWRLGASEPFCGFPPFFAQIRSNPFWFDSVGFGRIYPD
jgi:hypothetical protein